MGGTTELSLSLGVRFAAPAWPGGEPGSQRKTGQVSTILNCDGLKIFVQVRAYIRICSFPLVFDPSL